MSITAAELMTSPVVTAQPESTVSEVAELLVGRHISAVPICKPDGSLAGIVSEMDVMRPFRESARRKRERWLGLFAEGEELSQDFVDYLRHDTKAAAELMVSHVVTATKDATLSQLADLMISHGVKRIPIVEGDKLVGIVSRSDLLRAIAKAPAMAV